jgi:hypothetical protein
MCNIVICLRCGCISIVSRISLWLYDILVTQKSCRSGMIYAYYCCHLEITSLSMFSWWFFDADVTLIQMHSEHHISQQLKHHFLTLYYFSQVIADSCAQRAGVLKNDLIIQVDGNRVDTCDILLQVRQGKGRRGRGRKWMDGKGKEKSGITAVWSRVV